MGVRKSFQLIIEKLTESAEIFQQMGANGLDSLSKGQLPSVDELRKLSEVMLTHGRQIQRMISLLGQVDLVCEDEQN